jgi:hypothetical protein
MSTYEQIVNQPLLYVNNLQIARASTTTLTMAAGKCRDNTDTYDIEVDSTLTINGAVTGANGLDTGSLANNTWYAVHAIGDSTNYETGAALLSTSATAPSLPSGYNVFRRIGWALTNGSAQFIAFYANGNGSERFIQWDAPISVLAAGTETTFTPVSLAGAMPLQATLVYLNAAYTPNSATNTAQLRPTGSSVAEDSAPIIIGCGVAAAQRIALPGFLPQLATGNPSLDYLVQASDSLSLTVRGYQDLI